MLEKFAKLEEFLNKIMTLVGQYFLSFLNKLVPQKVFNKLRELRSFKKQKTQKAKAQVSSGTNWIIGKTKKYKEGISWVKDLFRKFKSVIFSYLESLKSFLLSSPIKSSLTFFSSITKKLANKIQNNLASGQGSQLIMAGVAAAMISVGIFGVYKSSQRIINQEYPNRKPASIQEYDEKPEYYYYKEKTLIVRNIKVPLLVTRAGKMSSLTMDFSIRTSTRFARYYLSTKVYKLKDYFFTSVEPIVSDFALEEEGKQVLKEKIQKELQSFLKKERVEGEVEEVNILFIVGS